MPLKQRILAIIIGFSVLVIIIELVRRRKLREEYCWLWLLTGIVIFVLSIWYKLLFFITRLLGILAPVSTVFFLGVVFLVLINLHYSVKISELTNQVKNLAQKLTLLSSDFEEHSQHHRKPSQKNRNK